MFTWKEWSHSTETLRETLRGKPPILTTGSNEPGLHTDWLEDDSSSTLTLTKLPRLLGNHNRLPDISQTYVCLGSLSGSGTLHAQEGNSKRTSNTVRNFVRRRKP